MDFKVNHELMQKIVSYLGNRPYAEVFGILEEIKNLPKIENEKKPEKEVN